MSREFGNQPFGTPPLIGDRQKQAKVMVMQQISQMSSAMYMQIVAHRLAHAGSPQPDFQEIARQSQDAAKGYFEGLGLVEFQKDKP